MTVQTLIDKAAKVVGNRHRLAKVLKCTVSQVYEWDSGKKRCGPPDRARLAAIAKEDPLQELVRATLEETAGTTRGEQLQKALGKLLRQTGEGLHGGAIAMVSLIFGMSLTNIPQCIKGKASYYFYI